MSTWKLTSPGTELRSIVPSQRLRFPMYGEEGRDEEEEEEEVGEEEVGDERSESGKELMSFCWRKEVETDSFSWERSKW